MAYQKTYASDGFVSGITIVSEETAKAHRKRLEEAEASLGSLHYKPKINTVLRSPHELATHPRALAVVEELIGPDILIYNVTYIIKEPNTESHVSWHQDLTYWGFDGDDQVSMWLALSPADKTSGCMQMIPGSHRAGRRHHETHPEDPNNLLFQGQEVQDVDTDQAVLCELKPGQASFHHGWTLHASMPNGSDDRRIGLNVQYIAPHMRQTKRGGSTAFLVRGEDAYGHYPQDTAPATDLDPEALRVRADMERLYRSIAGTE